MPRKEKQERGSYLTKQQKGGTTRAEKAEAKAATYKARGDAAQRAKAEKAARATAAAGEEPKRVAAEEHAAATAGGDQAPGAQRAAATSAGGNQAPAAPRAAWGSSLSALQLPGEGEEEGEWEWDGMEDLEQPGIEGHPCNFMRFPNAVLCACGSCFREELSNTSNHPDAYRPPKINGESNPPAGGDYRLRGGPWRSCGCTPEHLYEHGGAGAGESNPPAGKDFRESNPPAGGDFRLRGGDEGGEGNAPGDGALGARKDRTLDMLRTRLEKRDHMRTLPPSDADLLQASRCPISALHLLHNNSGLGDHRDLFQLTYCTLTKEERALAIEGAREREREREKKREFYICRCVPIRPPMCAPFCLPVESRKAKGRTTGPRLPFILGPVVRPLVELVPLPL